MSRVCDATVSGNANLFHQGQPRPDTLGGSMVEMQHLKIGDIVETADGSYEPDYAWSHYSSDKEATFYALDRPIPMEPMKR